MAHYQRRLFQPLTLRFDIAPCACGRYCGGLQVTVNPSDDLTCFPTVYADLYEHLSVDELWDVLDAAVSELRH